MEYFGIKVANGLGLGKCLILNSELPELNTSELPVDKVKSEVSKIEAVVSRIIFEYETIISDLPDGDTKELVKFNKNIVKSESMLTSIRATIAEKHHYADYAIAEYFSRKALELEQLDNPYLQERSKDIKGICSRVLHVYYGIEDFNPETLTEDVILVAYEITPNVLLSKHLKHIKGIISELGGKTSHVGILTTSLGIPSVFGIRNVTDIFKQGEILFINGHKGIVETNIPQDKVKDINKQILLEEELAKEFEQISVAKTKDGYHFEVCANAGDLSELDELDLVPLDGIGLFRTEFLYLNRQTEPSEEYLFDTYCNFLSKLNGKRMIVRTLDIGGDKTCPYIAINEEANPFLGYRAIRYCLDHPDFFKTSLKAILRASHYGDIAIMYPMISALEELRAANSILEQAKSELLKENILFNKNIKVGMMIEVPSMAIIADLVVTEVDFFSIGTNDLVQYTLAVDRGNPVISKLYSFFHPSVIRLLKQTIDTTRKYKTKFTGMCGEMAADPLGIIILVGLGIDEFSVNIQTVHKTKKYISLLNKKETEKFVKKILKLKTTTEIEMELAKYAKEKYGKFYL